MSTAELQKSLELIFGGHCAVPARKENADTLEIRVSETALAALIKHWEQLPVDSRPRLKGLTLSPLSGSARFLSIILDAGAKFPILVVDCESIANRPIPEFGKIWPYSVWWESELERFEGARLEASSERGGARWLPL